MEENIQSVPDQADPEEENPLLFWAAYQVGTDDKKHYLGNGKGGIRLFKKKDGEGGIEEFLDKNVPADRRHLVHVHQVQGKMAIPLTEKDIEELTPKPAPLPRIPHVLGSLPIETPGLPISTLAVDGNFPPSAVDALNDIESKRKKRKRK